MDRRPRSPQQVIFAERSRNGSGRTRVPSQIRIAPSWSVKNSRPSPAVVIPVMLERPLVTVSSRTEGAAAASA